MRIFYRRPVVEGISLRKFALRPHVEGISLRKFALQPLVEGISLRKFALQPLVEGISLRKFALQPLVEGISLRKFALRPLVGEKAYMLPTGRRTFPFSLFVFHFPYYLPMQNLEKMLASTSSVTISPPVISPSAWRQSRRSSASRSPGKPSLSPASTRRMASPARQSAS